MCVSRSFQFHRLAFSCMIVELKLIIKQFTEIFMGYYAVNLKGIKAVKFKMVLVQDVNVYTLVKMSIAQSWTICS